jgi:dipeptidyl aminopeptidase/acylaminoacyl peptidase
VSSGSAPVSGNGSGQLVFQTQSGGEIYRINADGTGLQRITTHGIDPQLSPDGTRVAFTRWTPRYELFTINLDGTGEQAWTQNWRQMKSPTWTADGSRLIFSWQSGGRLEAERARINLAEAAREGEEVDIPSNAIGIEVENGILEYTIPADALWRLKQVNLSDGQLIDLPTEQHSYGPTGHPQQANLFIYRGDRGLAMHNLETGTDQVITTDGRDHTPVISPDGNRIAVSYWQDDHWEVHVMNIDGQGRQRLTRTPLTVLAEGRPLTTEVVAGKERYVASENPAWNNAAPVWSPDGSQIAFVTDRRGDWEIWIMNADGTNQRPMFPNGALTGLDLTYNGVDERMLSWR